MKLPTWLVPVLLGMTVGLWLSTMLPSQSKPIPLIVEQEPCPTGPPYDYACGVPDQAAATNPSEVTGRLALGVASSVNGWKEVTANGDNTVIVTDRVGRVRVRLSDEDITRIGQEVARVLKESKK